MRFCRDSEVNSDIHIKNKKVLQLQEHKEHFAQSTIKYNSVMWSKKIKGFVSHPLILVRDYFMITVFGWCFIVNNNMIY